MTQHTYQLGETGKRRSDTMRRKRLSLWSSIYGHDDDVGDAHVDHLLELNEALSQKVLCQAPAKVLAQLVHKDRSECVERKAERIRHPEAEEGSADCELRTEGSPTTNGY